MRVYYIIAEFGPKQHRSLMSKVVPLLPAIQAFERQRGLPGMKIKMALMDYGLFRKFPF
jgi:hypothetical protein